MTKESLDHNNSKPSSKANSETTHFGYRQVATTEKANLVGEVFSSVAEKYDLMNDLMSFGIHRFWKHCAISRLNLKPGQKVLDLAGGSGDLTIKISPKISPNGHVTLADINPDMLKVGKRRLLDSGLLQQTDIVTADAEKLPFKDQQFDRIIIAFGLRNVTNKQKALDEMFRCLKPGGKLLILEFSKPVLPLINKIYDIYSFKLLPRIGDIVAGDADSYRYLAESIRMHPDQKTLQNMLDNSGLEDTKFHNLSSGIVALHWGYRY